MKELLKKFIPIICLIPLILGTVGYIASGETITNSLYASFALYFTNPISDAYNGFIEFARWTAPLVTATAILCIIQNLWRNIAWWFRCFSSDSVAVYSDMDINIKFNKGTKAIYPSENFKCNAKSHILLFSSDRKSLKFYENNKNKLNGKNVYIGLREIETGLIKDIDNVILFDINSSIARKLWKDIQLWNKQKQSFNIVIYGNGMLAQDILSYGLLLNLFSKEQRISYHVISDDLQFKAKHPELILQNNDIIMYHSASDEAIWDIVRNADITILADKVSVEMLQTFAVSSRSGEMYYYSPEKGDAGDYFVFAAPKAFGRNEDIFTDENIRRQKLIQAAMELNDQYAKRYNREADWNKLSNFLKNSNISSADFNEILTVLPSSLSDDELAELEHIRWCRFHYLNYWRNGTPINGKNKDDENRIHKDLVAYNELTPEEQDKNCSVVKMARKQI